MHTECSRTCLILPISQFSNFPNSQDISVFSKAKTCKLPGVRLLLRQQMEGAAWRSWDSGMLLGGIDIRAIETHHCPSLGVTSHNRHHSSFIIHHHSSFIIIIIIIIISCLPFSSPTGGKSSWTQCGENPFLLGDLRCPTEIPQVLQLVFLHTV